MTKRRGMTLMEVAVAGALLAVLMTVCLQLVAAAARRDRAMQDRQTALIEAGNVMERLSALPWEELTAEAAADAKRRGQARLDETLGEGQLEIDVTRPAADADLREKQITVIIGWKDESGNSERPVRLVAWRYRGGRQP